MDSSYIKYSIRAIRSASTMKTIIHGFYDQRVVIIHATDEVLYDVEGKIYRNWRNAERYAFKLLRDKINLVANRKNHET